MRIVSEQTLTQKAIAFAIFLNLLWIPRSATTSSADGFEMLRKNTTRRSHARRHSKSEHNDRYRYALLSSPLEMRKREHNEFNLKCPYVDLKKTSSTSLEVTWTLNNRQQITVTRGVPYVNPGLPISSIKSKNLKNRTILNVGVDGDRREFHYNEYREKFLLTITRLLSQDVGLWECKIIIDENGRKKTYTSRKQAKMAIKQTSPYLLSTTTQTILLDPVFGRPHDHSIEINRQSTSRETNIVFSRQDSDFVGDPKKELGNRVLIDRSSKGRKRNPLLTRRYGVTDRIQRFIKFVLEARGDSTGFEPSAATFLLVILYQIL